MGCSHSLQSQEIKSAGCLFTDTRHVLAGFQPKKNKKMKMISGFGGKQIPGETIHETAWRETLEELFDFSPEIIKSILPDVLKIPYFKTFTNGNYTVFVFTFDTLLSICKMFEERNLQSPFYSSFPTELFELILYRHPTQEAEVQEITLLPFAMCQTIDPYFLKDLYFLEKN